MHSAETAAPAATGLDVLLSPRGAARLRRGGGLVARVDIVTPPLALDADVVRLRDGRGQFLGMALWCARGPIAARLYSRTEQPLDARLLRERLARADGLRRALYAGQPRDAYRVVHGEADLLPGLFVDRYGEAAVIQTATAALDRREPLVAELVRELLGVSLVVVRDDGSARDLEELPRRKAVLIGGPEARVRFHDAGSLLEADLLVDRKTGGFLDQQENHALAADYARRLRPGGRALDAFTYHGGFALALARAGLSVTACDEDPQAIARARRNAELSGVSVDFQVHNAFDLLRSYEAGGRRFDVVVVDPPALAKRGRQQARAPGAPGAAQQAALRAYKELNLRAIRLVEPGGLLVTCSCSGRVSAADFGAMLDAPFEGDWGLTLEPRYIDLAAQHFKTVRLPVRFSNHASPDAAAKIDEAFGQRVEGVVDALLAKGLYVILDLHGYSQLQGQPLQRKEFAVAPEVAEARLLSMWQQLAQRYARKSPKLIFELFNEPAGPMNGEPWNLLAAKLLAVVRKTNPERAVMIGPGYWNSPRDIHLLRLPPDRNIIVSVHTYEPFPYTHQGLPWIKAAAPLGTPCCDAKQVDQMRAMLDTAVRWSETHGYPVHLGEFGVNNKAPLQSRIDWLRTMRRLLDERHIPFAYWDLAGGFGLYLPSGYAWNEPLRQALLD